eukprot:CCRYP_009637-RA/>CCRYP_009637-RA protein AED:0.03 eAED:0.02 QI:0/0/0/1/1/1/4/0/825
MSDLRNQKRLERKLRRADVRIATVDATPSGNVHKGNGSSTLDAKFAKLLAKNEDELLGFVAKINKLYQEKLKRSAPFVTFVICGMQSSGKSTIMERFMNAPLNIVQEGTGTRCPLDTTCIHDETRKVPVCELYGNELDESWAGDDLSIEEVFTAITEHNRMLASEDRFSTEALQLVYRSSNVQNMRFVDTPGIIANQGLGRDNREDIKKLLKEQMLKPNSKLCVLVEPKEFSTNSIIDFCDQTFGKGNWNDNAIVMMTKFDNKLGDAKSGSKTNHFFEEYHQNNIYPYLIITPTLAREDIEPEALFAERKILLDGAMSHEAEMFREWQQTHSRYREIDPDDRVIVDAIAKRIGFKTASDEMRKQMLVDTATRLPEVLRSLRKDLSHYKEELDAFEGRKRLMDPSNLKYMIGNMLHGMCGRISNYLDGDLETAKQFPDCMKDLEDELQEEDDSEWSSRRLGMRVPIEEEEKWRDIIESMFAENQIPEHVYPSKKFLGGKQFQRAVQLLNATMAEAFPDPHTMKDFVASGAGYLQGGLQRENWERCTLSIVRMASKTSIQPGINFFIKHAGSIFRSLFQVALQDMAYRDANTSQLLKSCPLLKQHLKNTFDDMIWEIMNDAADRTHLSLEPWYSCLDPTLPGFQPNEGEEDEDSNDDEDLYQLTSDGSYVKTPHKREIREKKLKESFFERLSHLSSMMSLLKGTDAKEMLRERERKRASSKKNFLPENRTSMINEDETDKILSYAVQYVFALNEQIQTYLNFQINHFVYNAFKEKIATFPQEFTSDDSWESLIPRDETLDATITDLKDKISGLQESLSDVQAMQMQF